MISDKMMHGPKESSIPNEHHPEQNPAFSYKKAPSQKPILVVEDCSEIRLLMTEVLKLSGYHSETADNGLDAINLIKNKNASHFAAIIMDINMPVMNGLQATRRLREQGLKLPIIALSANNLASDRKKGFEAGFSEYLEKPLDINKMKMVLDRFLVPIH